MWRSYLDKTERYLTEKLLPFWGARAHEPEYGGFNTNYDRDGKRTEVREKTLLCQARCLFTISHATRLGFDWPGAREQTMRGLAFLDRHFRDREHGGYFWIVDHDGAVRDDRKVVYGHAFLVYAFSEYALVSGNPQGRRLAEEVLDLLLYQAADLRYGGLIEHFTRNFQIDIMRPDGLVHKSLDVHMHLMEAMTALYELTGSERHRCLLEQLVDLIFARMIEPVTGTGISMFRTDWEPISNVQLGTLWGSDRFDPNGKEPQITSYGHNIELAWLYLHALDVMGISREMGRDRVMPIFEHTHRYGVDWRNGGLFVEGPRDGQASERQKEFWQQAEALVGFLDAYQLSGDRKYADAFCAVHDFVFERMIPPEPGEWLPLLTEDGTPIWNYMGHNWKTCYHTVRAMCEVVQRLRQLAS